MNMRKDWPFNVDPKVKSTFEVFGISKERCLEITEAAFEAYDESDDLATALQQACKKADISDEQEKLFMALAFGRRWGENDSRPAIDIRVVEVPYDDDECITAEEIMAEKGCTTCEKRDDCFGYELLQKRAVEEATAEQ